MLSDEEMVRATAWERIATIEHFITGRVSQWAKTLHPRERANCDVEDAAQSVKLKLARKNDKWEPSKGKYITFAETIIRHELEHLREKSRTVESPKNCAMRLRQYEAMDAGGAPQSKLETAEKMRRTIGGMDVAAEADGIDRCHPPEILATRDEHNDLTRRIRLAVARTCDGDEAAIVGYMCGFNGSRPRSAEEVAALLGLSQSKVIKLWTEARTKMRAMLEELNAGNGNQGI